MKTSARVANLLAGLCACGGEREPDSNACHRCREAKEHRHRPKGKPGRPRTVPRGEAFCRCGRERDDPRRVLCSCCRGEAHERYWHDRNLVLNHYGRRCACCGESEPSFLAIDHMPGTERGQKNLTAWLIQRGFPPGFRTLCHNCNVATRWGRACPHAIMRGFEEARKQAIDMAELAAGEFAESLRAPRWNPAPSTGGAPAQLWLLDPPAAGLGGHRAMIRPATLFEDLAHRHGDIDWDAFCAEDEDEDEDEDEGD